MTVIASPSRVNAVLGRAHGDTLEVVVLETPGGRWELPHAITASDEDPREVVTRALASACERVPGGGSIARGFHVDARMPGATGTERYLPVFSSVAEVSVVPDGNTYTNVDWVTLDEARARLDPERRGALDELAREEPYLRLCAYWARATRNAVPLNYAKIYGKGLPPTAAMWIPAGEWSDKHHYRLCCDRSSPHFGTLADFYDDHPWNIGVDLDDDEFEEDETEPDDEPDDNETERRLGREGDEFFECSPGRPTILEFVAHLAGDPAHTRDPFDD